MPATPLERLRKLCLALPEAHEVEAWGMPTFRVRNKLFAMYAHDHHGDGRIALWCKAAPENQELLVRARPDRYFVPPYVGPRGWVGALLDGDAGGASRRAAGAGDGAARPRAVRRRGAAHVPGQARHRQDRDGEHDGDR